jgi:cell volume regulation protein A
VTADHLGFVLLAGVGVVIAAVVAARLAHAAGLPALLVFLGLGLALGESGLGCGLTMPGWRRSSAWARWC